MDRGLSCEAEAFFSWDEHEHEWTGTPAETDQLVERVVEALGTWLSVVDG